MYNSGQAFYNRYRALTSQVNPFIRASGQERVVESAEQFSRGFHEAKMADKVPDPSYPYNIVTISETHGSNNT